MLTGALVLTALFTAEATGAKQTSLSKQTLRAPARVRAVWVRPFIDAGTEVRRSPEAGRKVIRRELERIKQAGIDTVYIESFFDGYTMYPSQVASMRPLEIKYGIATMDAMGEARGWDVLRTYLEEGDKLGLSIHAWFEVFFVWHTGLGDVTKSPIFSKHPDWLALDERNSPLVQAEAEGTNKEIAKVFLSPSHQGVRRFLVSLVTEIARNYPTLDGVQLDYIRYPTHVKGAAFDYSPDALRKFKLATNLDARKLSPDGTPREWQRWQDWKTSQVTQAVRELSGAIRRVRPRMIISAAVFPDFEEDLRIKMQDTRTWSREGLVDALLPMLYSTNFNRVDCWAAEFRNGINPNQTRVYPAFYVNHFYNAKTARLDSRYLELESRYNFDGIGYFAAQLLTDDLIKTLAPKAKR